MKLPRRVKETIRVLAFASRPLTLEELCVRVWEHAAEILANDMGLGGRRHPNYHLFRCMFYGKGMMLRFVNLKRNGKLEPMVELNAYGRQIANNIIHGVAS